MTDREVIFEDDPSVATGDPVWRRIPPGWWTFDHNEGRVRPTSQCFQYSSGDAGKKHPMSVTLGKGLTPEAAVAGQSPGFKLVGWTAGDVRDLDLGICRDEQPGIAAHGLVFTKQKDHAGRRRNNIPQSVRDRLSSSAQWMIELSPEEIEAARLRTATP